MTTVGPVGNKVRYRGGFCVSCDVKGVGLKKDKLLHSAARCHCFSTNFMLLIVNETSDTWRRSAEILTSHKTKNCHRCSSLGPIIQGIVFVIAHFFESHVNNGQLIFTIISLRYGILVV
jgi:hypothetical protein